MALAIFPENNAMFSDLQSKLRYAKECHRSNLRDLDLPLIESATRWWVDCLQLRLDGEGFIDI